MTDLQQAVLTLQKEIQNDPELAYSWHCNLAMPILDSINQYGELTKITPLEANLAACSLMKHLFDIDMNKNQYYAELQKKF